ncbi:MAG: PAS-domain containing protein [Rhodocyclales bacterium]|nr:PAS-domain containing protein [Rhodocyclales bacterium]
MDAVTIIGVSGLYLYLLFAVAFHIDAQARTPDSHWTGGAGVYAFSIAVYCTSWTFYGSVGRAAESGVGFLAVYIGPILVFILARPLLAKIHHVTRTQHITSIADFIAARYGKSQGLAGLVTVIAVIGIMPYISLQLKAVSRSLDLLTRYPNLPAAGATASIWGDTAFYLALLMALFVIVFGTRHVDATEQHRGMVTAIALESLVKLAAFLTIGVFATYVLFDGFSDLLARAAAQPAQAPLLRFGEQIWSIPFWMIVALSAVAIICLPRQFQVTFVECNDTAHLQRAGWVFPLYLVAINIFVLPIALAGLLLIGNNGISPDTYVLALPLLSEHRLLAAIAFIGGLSAATGMIIVETIALATMVCNDLVMPVLLRGRLIHMDSATHLVGLVKAVRRGSILFVLLLGYAYARLVGESYALVSIGLVSFCAAAQFAPALIGAVLWKGGTRVGALAGLVLGFAVWLYTLLLPSFARSGWLPDEFANEGVFFIEALKPYALFGLAGLDPISHSLFWSLVFNAGGYLLGSLWSTPGVLERIQAGAFVDASGDDASAPVRAWSADVTQGQLINLTCRFIDEERVRDACTEFAAAGHVALDPAQHADHRFIAFAEHLLAGAIGTALARVVIASAIREREMDLDNVVDFLTGASRAIETNWELTREAIENVPQGISMFDADLRLVVWNRRLFELLELPDQLAVVGTPLADFLRYDARRGEYGAGDPERLVDERLAMIRTNQPHQFERERPDGTVIEVRGKPLAGGGLVTTYTDITERKRTERELQRAYEEMEQRVAERTRDLRASEERFRDLAESASDWFWETDAELRFTYVSERFFEVSGLKPGQLIGKRRWEVADFDALRRANAKWDQHRADLEARRPFRRFEYEVVNREGTRSHIRISGKPVYDERKQFIGYRGTGTDITELVRAENELLHSEKLAALGGLVAGVAHEINTPVGIGLTAASYLDERIREFERVYTEGKVRRSDIETLIVACKETSVALLTNLRRAAELVRSFKQVAVDQSSDMKRRFDLGTYLAEVLLSLHPRFKRTRHQIVVAGADGIELDSYPGAFSQIITNLAINSLIHGFEGVEEGHIRIDAEVADHELVLSYRDDGRGMSAEQMKHLFEPFYTTRRGQGGSGLGMHVVYNLVTQTLRGRIEADSTPGNGVRFTIRVPLEKEEGGA